METIARSSLPFEEDQLWIESIRPWLAARAIQGNALDVAHYVTTEMLNNVRDHSGSSDVEILGAVNPTLVTVPAPVPTADMADVAAFVSNIAPITIPTPQPTRPLIMSRAMTSSALA